MRISITCRACGHEFSAPEKFAGRRAVCPECKKGVRVVDDGRTSSAEMTTKSGETKTRSSDTMRTRGGERSGKGLIVVGIIAAVVAGAFALNNLPDLTQPNVVVGPPPLVAADPAPAAPVAPVASTPPPSEPMVTRVGRQLEPDEIEPSPVAQTEEPDELPALADQPENLKPKIAKRPKPTSAGPRPTRDDAEEEFDTDRGQRLLAEMEKLKIARDGVPEIDDIPRGKQPTGKATRGKDIRGSAGSGDDGDDKDVLWKRLIARSKSMIEKTGVKQISGKPDAKTGVLTVKLESEPAEGDAEDMLVWTISAELVCADTAEDPARPEYAKVWKSEQRLGTLSQKAFDSGRLSQAIDTRLTDFFGSLRAARKRAERAVEKAKQADPPADTLNAEI